jgi:hypothetical protein
MNLKLATLFLVPAAILLLAGCGEASPTPVDIDATVEARVAGINIDATVEARLEQALTAVPTPTATATQVPPIDIELNSAMEEEVLALANSRDAWFLASDITTEALEGLYGSWSVICRHELSLADYKGAVYGLRPWLLEMLEMDLKDAQEAKRYYKVDSWSSPWAYVEQTWKLGDKIVFGPERQLYLIESGAWRFHDC